MPQAKAFASAPHSVKVNKITTSLGIYNAVMTFMPRSKVLAHRYGEFCDPGKIASSL